MPTMLEAEINRDINRQRFTTSLVSDIKKTAQEVSKMIPSLLSEYDTTTMTRTELNSLISETKRAINAKWSSLWEDIDPQLLKVATLEGAQIADLYDDYADELFTAPTAKSIEIASRTAIMTLTGSTSQSDTWLQFMRKNTSSTSKLVETKIREGFGSNLTLNEMTQQLRGKYNRRTKKYDGGIINGTATSRAEALVRTGTSHFSNLAKDKFADTNKDIIESRVYFITLDNRTTTICLGRNGNEYVMGENYPALPAHWNCRSVYLFKTKSFDPRKATRPITTGRKSKEAESAYNKRKQRQDALRDSRAEKRANGEATPETTSKIAYKGRKDNDIFNVKLVSGEMGSDEFMRNNPRWFVESSLGKKRASMFLDDGVSLDKFSDLTGRQLTIKELEKAGY